MHEDVQDAMQQRHGCKFLQTAVPGRSAGAVTACLPAAEHQAAALR
jgi:hypothetical protein